MIGRISSTRLRLSLRLAFTSCLRRWRRSRLDRAVSGGVSGGVSGLGAGAWILVPQLAPGAGAPGYLLIDRIKVTIKTAACNSLCLFEEPQLTAKLPDPLTAGIDSK